jgi:hypothetical protein
LIGRRRTIERQLPFGVSPCHCGRLQFLNERLMVGDHLLCERFHRLMLRMLLRELRQGNLLVVVDDQAGCESAVGAGGARRLLLLSRFLLLPAFGAGRLVRLRVLIGLGWLIRSARRIGFALRLLCECDCAAVQHHAGECCRLQPVTVRTHE